MKFTIQPKDRCPCGSGDEYRKCHSPKKNRREDNIWKGPDFDQNIYFGDGKPLTGIYFDKARKGEFKLLRDDDRIPLPRFYCVDDTILECRVIVRSLSVSTENENIRYSGSLEVQGNVQYPIPVLIGCHNVNQVISFDAALAGKPIFYERGNWGLYIGEDENPMARIKKEPQWFRYFHASGFLVESISTGEINFNLMTKSRGFNLFTLCLPFNDIEIPHPQIAIKNHRATCQLEIEKENISWDLVLHQDMFDEKKSRKDSKVFLCCSEDDIIKLKDFDINIRKHFPRPLKLRLSISVPDLSPTIGKFTEIFKNTIRAISENHGFTFNEEILEANFRDHVLTVLKSMGFYAFAEPSRRYGFVDILLRKDDSEGIIEFKVWGRRKYKEVIDQVLGYGTPWTTEYATVMINPNKDSIVPKFVENAKRSKGFKFISDDDRCIEPLNTLVSHHYLSSWEKPVAVTHFIINTCMLS